MRHNSQPYATAWTGGPPILAKMPVFQAAKPVAACGANRRVFHTSADKAWFKSSDSLRNRPDGCPVAATMPKAPRAHSGWPVGRATSEATVV